MDRRIVGQMNKRLNLSFFTNNKFQLLQNACHCHFQFGKGQSHSNAIPWPNAKWQVSKLVSCFFRFCRKSLTQKIRTNFQRWNHCFNFNRTSRLYYRYTFIKNLQKLICTEEPQSICLSCYRVVFAVEVEVYGSLAYFFNKFSAIINYRYSLTITKKMLNLEWSATTCYKNWNSERQKDRFWFLKC